MLSQSLRHSAHHFILRYWCYVLLLICTMTNVVINSGDMIRIKQSKPVKASTGAQYLHQWHKWFTMYAISHSATSALTISIVKHHCQHYHNHTSGVTGSATLLAHHLRAASVPYSTPDFPIRMPIIPPDNEAVTPPKKITSIKALIFREDHLYVTFD